jgi:Uma2 family endonuclease
MVQAPERLYTVEEFERLEDSEAFELDDGVLVEKCMGAESQWVMGELFFRMKLFPGAPASGIVLPSEIGLRIFPERPRRIPRPDGGFISYGRLGARKLPKGDLTVAPELTIEAVSPGEPGARTDRKVQEYLSAGVRLVWVLYPDTGTALVHRADGTVSRIPADGALDGEDVLPGFTCPLREIMPAADSDA